MSELTRQKAANEELQNQILANIRQQQQIVHTRRESSSSQQGSGGSTNVHSSGNAQGKSPGMASAVVAGQQIGMSGHLENLQYGSQMQHLPGNSRGSFFGSNNSNEGSAMQGDQVNQNNVGVTSSSLPNAAQATLLRQQSMPNSSTQV